MYKYKLENSDLVVGSGSQLFELTSDIGQDVLVLFLTSFSSWFFDTTFGIDYMNFTYFLNSKQANPCNLLNNLLKKAIQGIDGVTNVFNVSGTFNNVGIYQFSASFTTTDSSTIFNLSITGSGTGSGTVTLTKTQGSPNIKKINSLRNFSKLIKSR